AGPDSSAIRLRVLRHRSHLSLGADDSERPSLGSIGMSERRALVISAHPDDIEFGCAGTVCRWVDEGWDVRYAIVTFGQKGVEDARQDPHQFGRLREQESRRAAEICGVSDVT